MIKHHGQPFAQDPFPRHGISRGKSLYLKPLLERILFRVVRAAPITDEPEPAADFRKLQRQLRHRFGPLRGAHALLGPPRHPGETATDRPPAFCHLLRFRSLQISSLQSRLQDQRLAVGEHDKTALSFSDDHVGSPESRLSRQLRDGRQEVPPHCEKPFDLT